MVTEEVYTPIDAVRNLLTKEQFKKAVDVYIALERGDSLNSCIPQVRSVLKELKSDSIVPSYVPKGIAGVFGSQIKERKRADRNAGVLLERLYGRPDPDNDD